jgi:hypothetical protein
MDFLRLTAAAGVALVLGALSASAGRRGESPRATAEDAGMGARATRGVGEVGGRNGTRAVQVREQTVHIGAVQLRVRLVG